MRSIVAIHVGVDPLPQTIELLFLVELNGDHHAVGPALGAHIAAADVFDIGAIASDRKVDALGVVVTIEELLPGPRQLGFDVSLALAEKLREQVAILAGVEGPAPGWG